jgi:hypothetical protein
LWLHYAGWLVAGLTFQLAADIIETAIRSRLGRYRAACSDCRHPDRLELLSRAGPRGS